MVKSEDIRWDSAMDCIVCRAPIGKDDDYHTIITEHGDYHSCEECIP